MMVFMSLLQFRRVCRADSGMTPHSHVVSDLMGLESTVVREAHSCMMIRAARLLREDVGSKSFRLGLVGRS